MVAFVVSMIITIAGVAAIIWYGKRRPVGAPLSWGEAIAASTFAFFLMFWAYGVVPHQWLTWAGNELGWRPDKILHGPGDIVDKLPFTVDYEKLRDIIVSGIYGVFLAGHVGLWVWWNNRGKAKPTVAIDRSQYGRPLVKQG